MHTPRKRGQTSPGKPYANTVSTLGSRLISFPPVRNSLGTVSDSQEPRCSEIGSRQRLSPRQSRALCGSTAPSIGAPAPCRMTRSVLLLRKPGDAQCAVIFEAWSKKGWCLPKIRVNISLSLPTLWQVTISSITKELSICCQKDSALRSLPFLLNRRELNTQKSTFRLHTTDFTLSAWNTSKLGHPHAGARSTKF